MAVQNLTSSQRLFTRYLQLFSLSSSRIFKHNTASTLATATLSSCGHQFTPSTALAKSHARCKQQCTLQPYNHCLAGEDISNFLRSEYSHMRIQLRTKYFCSFL